MYNGPSNSFGPDHPSMVKTTLSSTELPQTPACVVAVDYSATSASMWGEKRRCWSNVTPSNFTVFSFATSESLIVSWLVVMCFGVEKKMAFDLEAVSISLGKWGHKYFAILYYYTILPCYFLIGIHENELNRRLFIDRGENTSLALCLLLQPHKMIPSGFHPHWWDLLWRTSLLHKPYICCWGLQAFLVCLSPLSTPSLQNPAAYDTAPPSSWTYYCQHVVSPYILYTYCWHVSR